MPSTTANLGSQMLVESPPRDPSQIYQSNPSQISYSNTSQIPVKSPTQIPVESQSKISQSNQHVYSLVPVKSTRLHVYSNQIFQSNQ